MDLLPRLGISLFLFLIGTTFIVWSAKLDAFSGILGIIEAFLPEALRSNLRRVVNSFVGLLFILFALLIFFLARK